MRNGKRGVAENYGYVRGASKLPVPLRRSKNKCYAVWGRAQYGNRNYYPICADGGTHLWEVKHHRPLVQYTDFRKDMQIERGRYLLREKKGLLATIGRYILQAYEKSHVRVMGLSATPLFLFLLRGPLLLFSSSSSLTFFFPSGSLPTPRV